jgi:mono/diheme cytochrome c family protein
LGETGTPVFRQGEAVYNYSFEAGPHTQAFLDWLTSDVGKGTIEGFKSEGVAEFSADVAVKEKVQVAELTGDLVMGESESLLKCGRCHVVNEKNRMNAIGSTPSFALMRSFPDWQMRFETFFLLKPHSAFTQVEGVTDPFPDHLPSPIAPIEVTMDQIEAITAYVGSIAPADLGAPIQARNQ